jgi:proteic killer suppression protein
MIKHFRCAETKKIWEGYFSKKLPSDIQDVARRKLRMINNSNDVGDLRVPPNNRLEVLKGDKKVTIAFESMTSGEYALFG